MKYLILFTFFLSFSMLSTLKGADKPQFMSKEMIRDLILHPNKPESFQGKRKMAPPIPKNEMPTLEEVIGKNNLENLANKRKQKREISFEANLQEEIQEQRGTDFRYRDSSIKQQHSDYNTNGYSVGTCTAFGLAGAVENLVNNPSLANLSERHLWDHYRITDMDEAIYAGRKYYTTEEEWWPAKSTKPKTGYLDHAHTRIIKSALHEDFIPDVTKALDQGFVAYIGLSTPSDMYQCKGVIKSMASEDGGHALAVVGYQLDPAIKGGGYLILKNSWGADCGDNGYHYLPFQFCNTYGNYCWFHSIEAVETKYPSLGDVEPEPTPESTPDVITFDPAEAKLNVKAYKKSYSSSHSVYLTVVIPDGQKNLVEAVEYSLKNSSIGKAVLKNAEKNFQWSFSTERRYYELSYTIRLYDGQIFTQNTSIEY